MSPEIKVFEAPNPDGKGTHKISYTKWGSGEKLLVCVHGLTRNGRDFDWLAKEMAEHYTVICPDMAGRHKSEWFENYEWYDNMVYIADTLALIKHVGAKSIDWVGTSMGGIMGMIIAATHPHLIGKMVLNDIGAEISKAGMQRINDYMKFEAKFKTREETERKIREIFAPFKIEREEDWQKYFDFWIRKDVKGYYSYDYDPKIGQAFPPPEKVDLWRLWEAIQTPILLLRGGLSDILERDVAEKMAQGHNVEFVEFAGYGHVPPLINDEQIAVVKQFLL